MRTTLTRCAAIAAVGAVLLTGCNSNDPAGPAAGTRSASTGIAAGQQPPAPPGIDQPEASGTAGSAGQPEPGDQTALDVCGLLTPEEVEQALGQPVEMEAVSDTYCNYTTDAGGAAGPTEVLLNVVRPMNVTPDVFVQSVEVAHGDGFRSERVEGIGEAAVLVTGLDAAILNVLVGDAWVTLSVFSPDEAARSVELATQLTRRVIERLP